LRNAFQDISRANFSLEKKYENSFKNTLVFLKKCCPGPLTPLNENKRFFKIFLSASTIKTTSINVVERFFLAIDETQRKSEK